MPAEQEHAEGAATHAPTASIRDRLTAMLVVQRRQREARDAEIRGSTAWTEADETLDLFNSRLWHLAATGQMPPDSIGGGVNADIDSIPEDDEVFRGAVVRSIRDAIAERIRDDLDDRAHGRLARSAQTVSSALSVMALAEQRLRRTYPDAELQATEESEDTIGVVAYRDAEVA